MYPPHSKKVVLPLVVLDEEAALSTLLHPYWSVQGLAKSVPTKRRILVNPGLSLRLGGRGPRTVALLPVPALRRIRVVVHSESVVELAGSLLH